jgi:hypothetical protein
VNLQVREIGSSAWLLREQIVDTTCRRQIVVVLG